MLEEMEKYGQSHWNAQPSPDREAVPAAVKRFVNGSRMCFPMNVP